MTAGSPHDLPWSVLASLSREQAAEMLQSAVPERWEKGRDLVVEGDRADLFYLVDEGHLGVTVRDGEGGSALLAVLTRGDSFGELALVDDSATRTATVTAMSGARTLAISRADFLALRKRRPDFDRALTAMLVAQIRRLSRQVLDAHLLDAEAKVRRQLADLARAFASGGRESVVVPLTQDQVAQLCGIGRQRANEVLKELERAGLLRLGRGSIEIIDAASPIATGSS